MQTIRFNAEQYRRNWIRMHSSYEKSQYRTFKAALDEQVGQVVSYVKQHGAGNIPLSVLVSPQPIQLAYKHCYSTIGVKQAGYVYNWVNRTATKSTPSFFSEQWRKLMSLFYETAAADRVKGVTETTRDRIRTALSAAEAQGLGTNETADYLVATLDDPDFNRDRAMVISRTESTAAANYGASLGAESSDYETGKQWLSVVDRVTRPAHVDADGQLVASYDMFTVGGEQCMFPGDLTLSPAEAINCRCCSVYVPLVGDNGLPVLKVR